MRTLRCLRNELAVLLLIKVSFFDLKSSCWQIEETVDFPGQCSIAQISKRVRCFFVESFSFYPSVTECLEKNYLYETVTGK